MNKKRRFGRGRLKKGKRGKGLGQVVFSERGKTVVPETKRDNHERKEKLSLGKRICKGGGKGGKMRRRG